MKLIAHRGNIGGPNPSQENNPEYIEAAIAEGYDVEIDIRYNTLNKKFYLGHDESQYLITWFWLEKYIDNLWIHCKNIEALYEFAYAITRFNYFWHQEDDFTLTSKNYIWTYPGKSYTPKSIIVMPEWDTSVNLTNISKFNCHGVCSDFVNKIKF
jgi:hypothetical protein